jgi:hypothetical protein
MLAQGGRLTGDALGAQEPRPQPEQILVPLARSRSAVQSDPPQFRLDGAAEANAQTIGLN